MGALFRLFALHSRGAVRVRQDQRNADAQTDRAEAAANQVAVWSYNARTLILKCAPCSDGIN